MKITFYFIFGLLCSAIPTGCKHKVAGCTSPQAVNFNNLATDDDGSCVSPKIGDQFQGGVVFYILKPADKGFDVQIQHGLIAAPEDQGKNIRWNNGNNLTTDATPKDIGWGKFNTNKIVNQQGSGSYAASICDQLVYGGYNDWYLPSIYELKELQLQSQIVGGFESGKAYWSSTESNTDKAWVQYFGSATNQSNPSKSSSFNVRAIRSF